MRVSLATGTSHQTAAPRELYRGRSSHRHIFLLGVCASLAFLSATCQYFGTGSLVEMGSPPDPPFVEKTRVPKRQASASQSNQQEKFMKKGMKETVFFQSDRKGDHKGSERNNVPERRESKSNQALARALKEWRQYDTLSDISHKGAERNNVPERRESKSNQALARALKEWRQEGTLSDISHKGAKKNNVPERRESKSNQALERAVKEWRQYGTLSAISHKGAEKNNVPERRESKSNHALARALNEWKQFGTLSDRRRLTQLWISFEKHWTHGKALAEYLQTNHARREVPHQKLPDFVQAPLPRRDVILATHMSVGAENMDRLDILQRFWRGPISLAVRITAGNDIDSFFDYFEDNPVTANWTVHFLLEHVAGFDPDSLAAQYCHNRLRNLALHSPSIPDFVLQLDLDFIPPHGGYPLLMSLLQEHPQLWEKLRRKTFLVLPVHEILHPPEDVQRKMLQKFGRVMPVDTTNARESIANENNIATQEDTRENAMEGNLDDSEENVGTKKKRKRGKRTKQKRDHNEKTIGGILNFAKGVESDLPLSREELKYMVDVGVAVPWHSRHSHEATNLEKYWKYQEGSTNKPTYSIKPSGRYEPHFIGYKPDMPRYWEAFRGFGLDKQSFVRECILAGYRFEAVYKLYVTHLAHPSNRNLNVKGLNEQEWTRHFQPYLEQTYEKELASRSKRWSRFPGYEETDETL